MDYFYPRPPCGGRQVTVGVRHNLATISIHVPLAGDDRCWDGSSGGKRDFYPRPPCGGRPFDDTILPPQKVFLSTSPLRGTTGRSSSHPFYIKFLSTSPLRGTTGQDLPGWHLFRYFYPRPPCGGRRADDLDYAARQLFLSTSPLRGTTP